MARIYILPVSENPLAILPRSSGMFEGARHPGDVCFAPTGVERRCESFEETEQSGSHMVSKGTFDTYLIILASI